MTIQDVNLPLPEDLYLRLQHVAEATQQSLTDVLLHAVQMGSPPDWSDVPAEFQADLAAMDRLSDDALWKVARSRQDETEQARYEDLLEKNAAGVLTAEEELELAALRTESDRFMLRKAHAAALLRWRGHRLPPSESL